MAAKQSAYQPHIHRSKPVINNDQHLAELLQSVEITSHSYTLPLLKDFIGRQADVQQAISLWQQLRPRSSARVMAIVGQAGVGKSAFALHLAHQLKPLFPDAQIYLNLRADQLASPGTVTQQLLGALSATDLHQLSNRRILLLLDHLEDQAQLRPLLALGTTCTILVTSRQPLSETATLELQPMSISDALLLLQAIAPSKSIQSEPKTARAIARLCDALPLPLRIVAGLLQTQPELQPGNCLQLLSDERQRCEQANLSYPAICASFNLSYQHLEAEPARLLRLIGLLAEPNFTLKIAAALTEMSIDTTQASIAQLLSMHLLEFVSKERYRLPSLLLRLVKRQLAIVESSETRQSARLRLSQIYQETAETISSGLGASYHQLSQHRGQLNATQVKDRITFKQLSLNAQSWFEIERPNLLAVLNWAIQAEAWQSVLPTVVSVTQFVDRRGDRSDWKTILLAAIAAAKGWVSDSKLHNCSITQAIFTCNTVTGKKPKSSISRASKFYTNFRNHSRNRKRWQISALSILSRTLMKRPQHSGQPHWHACLLTQPLNTP
ncbi:MAG: hypothetical protein HC866_23630 [Leptolyngbyaceae cyanobacterium RU_5_1]|nr:hypothetical protein [Leptolyngbyaceae cyanobacterium RU_5_1]